MSRRPTQKIEIFSVRKRDPLRTREGGTKMRSKPWRLKWRIDGRERSRSWRTKPEGERYRSRLLLAQEAGERFDLRTGEPESWGKAASATTVFEWCRQWLAEQWPELAPRTRTSYLQALARFAAAAVIEDAPARPTCAWSEFENALRPDVDPEQVEGPARWAAEWSLSLPELTKVRMAEIDRLLGVGADGQQLAPETAGRFRKPARACIRWAVEVEKIPVDPWPERPRGRSTRKANRRSKAIDIRHLPGPDGQKALLARLPNKIRKAESRRWQVMSAIGCYAGLRPSEIKYLRADALQLPEKPGEWGLILVDEADDGESESALPKTGKRRVPCQPLLCDYLSGYLEETEVEGSTLLFVTANGTLPSDQNWGRALARASKAAGLKRRMTPYDCRHACATSWIRAGVPLGTAALWLGHSVETLVGYYVHAFEGDHIAAMAKIDDLYAAGMEGRRDV